jgi:hypothetical protein
LKIQEQRNGNILITDVDPSKKHILTSIIEFYFPDEVEYETPEYPKFNKWSERVPLTRKGERVSKEYKRSGVYKIYHKDKVIYIGETRCDGEVVSRKGMWSRRADFMSTVQSNGKVKNPYGNALKFLEHYTLDDMKYVSHSFHYVHPKYCKEAELELLTEYYKEHNTLPILQTDIDYKRVYKENSKVKKSNYEVENTNHTVGDIHSLPL